MYNDKFFFVSSVLLSYVILTKSQRNKGKENNFNVLKYTVWIEMTRKINTSQSHKIRQHNRSQGNFCSIVGFVYSSISDFFFVSHIQMIFSLSSFSFFLWFLFPLLIIWITALFNSKKLWAMLCRATQDGRLMVESSDKMWSIGEENGKPLQHSYLENTMNGMKREKDILLKDELPR